MVNKHMKSCQHHYPLGKYKLNLPPTHQNDYHETNKMTPNVGKDVEQLELFLYIVGGKVNRHNHLDN